MASRDLLSAYWPARREPVEHCAARLRTCLTELAHCDKLLEAWYTRNPQDFGYTARRVGVAAAREAKTDPASEGRRVYEKGRSRKDALNKRVPIDDLGYLQTLLLRGQNRRDVGGAPIGELGFTIGVWNGAYEDQEAGLSITCGLSWVSPNPAVRLGNSVVLTLPRMLGTLGEPATLARALAAVAQAWEPAWAGVMSRDAMNARGFDPDRPFVDWMVYVPSRIAQVPAPASVLHPPSGGSVVVVQPSPPAAGDAAALAAIQAVQAALAAG